jgi:hypothetical protein
MRTLRTTRGLAMLTAFVLCAGLTAWGQDSGGQSLGDVARKTRKEHSSSDHVASSHVTNEDDDGPDSGGVWRVRLCQQSPCYELSVNLPRSPKWSRSEAQPRPVLIPLPGQEEDSRRTIRVYAAESIPQTLNINAAERIFLQGWFARPEYFGHAAKILLDEHPIIDGRGAVIAHFTVNGVAQKYRGLSVVALTTYGSFGFACVFREEDTEAAASTCDAIVKSANAQTLEPARPRYYPPYQPPPQYYPRYDEPRGDPQGDPQNDPEDDPQD